MFRPMLCNYLNFQRSGGFGLFFNILNHQFPFLWEKKHEINDLPIMVFTKEPIKNVQFYWCFFKV
jgi:hypothetical protein